MRTHPASRTCHMLDLLLDHAYSHLDSDPKTAATLTGLVLRSIDAVLVPAELAPVRERLRGRTWMERGSALRLLGRMAEAADAFERAISIYAADPQATIELAAARRGLAFVRHQLGDSEDALQMITADLPLFAACNDRAGLARSMLFKGAIEFESGAALSATGSFAEALAVARLLGDEPTEARLLLNLGHCAEARGDLDVAFRFFEAARARLLRLGMHAEERRVNWGLARLLAARGEIEQAIEVMEHIAEEMLVAGLAVDAHEAWLDVVETLVLAEDRDMAAALALAANLVEFFSARGLLRNANHAAALLQEATRSGGLTREKFEQLRDLIRKRS